MKKQGCLYHYTSLQTLCSIIKGISEGSLYLRAANAKKMNDPNDCYYFIDIVGKVLGQSKSDIDKMIKQKMKDDTPYLISFSERKDDLHMWDSYADKGKGVSLGIDKGMLIKSVNSLSHSYHIFAKLYKCTYLGAKQLRIHEKFRFIFEQSKSENITFQERIHELSNIVKHPCYKYEKEHRCVIVRGKKERHYELIRNTDWSIIQQA